MLTNVVLAAALAGSAVASPLMKRGAAASNVGNLTADVFPPTAPVGAPTSLFPPESVIGYPGTTLTGKEPMMYQTAAAAPSHTAIYPLVVPAPTQTASSNAKRGDDKEDSYGATKPGSAKVASGFNPAQYWGNIGPQYSVDSSYYGLDGASPRIPEGCEAIQVHMYMRHGCRYPSAGAAIETFAAKVNAAAVNKTTDGFTASGALEFLNTWSYKLGKELLVPFGRQQNFNHGVSSRLNYGALLNNFTEQNTLPVFRTQSQDRMVKTMQHFAAGFFGIPTEGQYSLSIGIESPGLNQTGAPYESCTNADVAKYGSGGSAAQTAYYATKYVPTAARLNKLVKGALSFTPADVVDMVALCAWETTGLGYSKFCEIFTEEEFVIYEAGFDLAFYGNNGFGGPTAAAQGKGYLQEFVSRLTATPISQYDTSTNSTLDSSNLTFPLHQSIYADAAHEVAILDFLTALNLTALQGNAPSTTNPESDGHLFSTSKVVPMGTFWTAQVLECQASVPTKQIRFIVNDAVIPQTYKGCDPKEFNGLCAFDTVVKALEQRLDDIDYDFACNGNYSVPAGLVDLNGLPPKK